MNDNISLQIAQIENKIERLEIQKEFYEKILNSRSNNNKEDSTIR